MGFYADNIEPRLVSCICGMKPISDERAKFVPKAQGRVLEIGFGSGHNEPFYDREKVSHLYALEPSAAWRKLAEPKVSKLPFSVEWLDLPGEEIPLADESVDTVLVTFSLCTIPGVEQALAGMRRVLKPDGKLVFLEHGAAPDRGVARWQGRINGVWGKLAGGCHLNRKPAEMVSVAGFRIETLEQHYVPWMPKIAGFVTGGVAGR
ncbi:class I SAM-dependent methyltransferase [Hyphococcus flavus]|uniref:Class I SAM-dependent methyltransferase n=1 Tax=Hyphococcus flavus TaxID=1866326 RepID=A0AAE9ZHG0_9PROT|nr:class I SAM-dependent methyltransferase [Hyphococcus flavus]WDI32632.1 class I SAM-dependent methyltransferase [Hyphococcus flavus]